MVKYSLPRYHKKKSFIAGYHSKFMFLKQCKALNNDPFTELLRIAYNKLILLLKELCVLIFVNPKLNDRAISNNNKLRLKISNRYSLMINNFINRYQE